jgi:hypothetical protein
MSANKQLEQELFGLPKPTDPDGAKAYDQTLFEQYKLYVELMDKVSERRNNANSFFIAANSTLLTVFSAIIAVILSADLGVINLSGFVVVTAVVAICGLLICITWYNLIQSYRNLNTGKFKIIHLLETRLPARLYDAEWVGMGQGSQPTLYRPLTHIEKYIPIIFGVLYLVVAVVLIVIFATSGGTPIP